MKKGKPADLDITQDSPSGCAAVDNLVSAAVAKRRPAFIEGLTEVAEHGRRIRRSPRYFNLPDEERQRAERLLADYRKRRTDPPPRPDYYTVEDVCGRVSGIGSMGRYRYAVLINGKSSAEARNVILEFKESRPSGYDLARGRDAGRRQPCPSGPRRVVGVQRQSQASSSGHLGFYR